MRIFFLGIFLFFLLLGSPSAYAQLVDGSIAPDFTIVDIEGNPHNLYEKLDEGKIVIFDVFATWCGPCWNYAQSHNLEKIWQQYGPPGTDEVFIFYVESDPLTGIDDLEGTGSSTFGDYTADVNYPIFNTSSINSAYEINNYPTVYMICPNKRTTLIPQIAVEKVPQLLYDACSVPEGVNNGELLFFESDLDPFCEEAYYTPSIRFQNVGTNDIQNASFDLSINGTLIKEDFLWQGMLSPFQTTKINFPSINLQSNKNKNIEVVINKVNDKPDSLTFNNSLMGTKLSPKAFSEKVLLEIQTDNFGYEVYWELRNDNGVAIASGGNDLVTPDGPKPANVLLANPNGYYLSDTLYSHEISLPYNGCYEFYIIDDYQDGICCSYGDGFFRLKDQTGNIVLSGGERYSVLHQDFERTPNLVATQELSSSFQLTIFPNPARDLLHFEIQQDKSSQGYFSIYNNLGQVIRSATSFQPTEGNTLQSVDLSDIPTGIYLLQVYMEKEVITQKFVIE